MYDSYKNHSKYPFDNYQINVLHQGVIFLWLIIVHVIKMFANLYGYVMMYDSYKHPGLADLQQGGVYQVVFTGKNCPAENRFNPLALNRF